MNILFFGSKDRGMFCFQSILDCLEFFYPRMSHGGIILSHDYTFKGVKRAFDEFFKDKPEVVIKLFGSQCMVVKQ